MIDCYFLNENTIDDLSKAEKSQNEMPELDTVQQDRYNKVNCI